MTQQPVQFGQSSLVNINLSNFSGISDWTGLWDMATTGDNQRMIVACLPNLFFTTYDPSSDTWSTPTQFGNHSAGWGYVGVCVTEDGSRVMVSDYFMKVSVYFWNGTTYSNPVMIPNDPGSNWVGLACTPDGSVLVGQQQYGHNYYTRWNPATNNYNGWTQTLNPSSNANGITLSADGLKIVYGGGDSSNTLGDVVYYSRWDVASNNYILIQTIVPTVSTWSDFSMIRDGSTIIIAAQESNQLSEYAVYNSETDNYEQLTTVPKSSIPNSRSIWLSYDNSVLYTTYNNSYSVFGYIYKTPVSIPIPPTPTLYLGDELTITQSDINFNNANVFVKAPVYGLNVANKDYVDANLNTANSDIIIAETAERVATNSVLVGLISQLQARKSALVVQMNNLYQYFFNENRDGPAPTR